MKLIDADALWNHISDALNTNYMTLGENPYINCEYIRELIDHAPGFEWTALDERPPKHEGFYLCHYKDLLDDGEDVATMYFNGETFGLPLPTNNGIKVLHWMPALWPGTDGEVAVYMSKDQYKWTFGIKGEET
ncbi:MAG: hypothetical protein LUD72_14040 [Bacteroidales bacterium]|nr:hypothetical protein [Bacteroidales bacterium]